MVGRNGMRIMLHKETELKFEVTPRDLRKLRAARTLQRKPLKEEDLVSVYFDTPQHTLAGNVSRCACGATATSVSKPSNPEG